MIEVVSREEALVPAGDDIYGEAGERMVARDGGAPICGPWDNDRLVILSEDGGSSWIRMEVYNEEADGVSFWG